MLCKITQYGKSLKSGGWDKYGDSYTDKFLGNIGTILSGVHCAVSKSLRTALNLTNGDWLKITFKTGETYLRQVGDEAPEDDPRCDFFNYFAFDRQMDALGDFAEVTKLSLTWS